MIPSDLQFLEKKGHLCAYTCLIKSYSSVPKIPEALSPSAVSSAHRFHNVISSMSASKEVKARMAGPLCVAWRLLAVDSGGLKLNGLSLVERLPYVAGGGLSTSTLSKMLLLSAALMGPKSCCRKLDFLSSSGLFSLTFLRSTSSPRLFKRLTVSNTVFLFSTAAAAAAGKFRERREFGFMKDGS